MVLVEVSKYFGTKESYRHSRRDNIVIRYRASWRPPVLLS